MKLLPARSTVVMAKTGSNGGRYNLPPGMLHTTVVPSRDLTATLVEARFPKTENQGPRAVKQLGAPPIENYRRQPLDNETVADLIATVAARLD